METTNKLFYSGTKFFTENEEDYRITVRISLKAHDILGVKYDSFGAILKNFG